MRLYLSKNPVALFLVLWYLNLPVSLDAQDIHKKPFELFTVEQINALETQVGQPQGDFTQIAQTSRTMLNQWYRQFIKDKRIADQRHYPLFDPVNSNINITRLIAEARNRKNIAPYFLGDSPYLQRLHIVLGMAYEKNNDPIHALWSYSMALRYSKRETRLSGPREKNKVLKGFLQMSRSWSNPDRLEEESDPQQKTAAQQFNQQLKEYYIATSRCEKLQREVYAKEAQMVRGQAGPADVTAVKNSRDAVCDSEKRLFESLSEIQSGAYNSYVKTRNKKEAGVAYNMALLVKKIEDQNTINFRKKNEGSFLRSIGDTRRTNKTKSNLHTGYSRLLELAHFLDPDDRVYLELLAIQNQRSQRVKEAIAWQLKYLELSKTQNSDPGQYKKGYLRLSQLYESNREYVQSANALETYFKLEDQPDNLSEHNLRLANLHFKYTGRLERALELFEKESRRLDQMELANNQESGNWKRKVRRHSVLEKSAFIQNRFRNPDQEEDLLLRAVLVYQNMNEEYKQLLIQKTALDKKLRDIKEQILEIENEELQGQYYLILQKELPELINRIDTLNRRMGQLNHAKILDRLVKLAWQKKQFRKIQGYYREIINIGNSRQATLARRNLDLIEKIMSDGIVRPLYVK